MNINLLSRKLSMLVLVSLLCLTALAQVKGVRGIVKDATGEPLIGVNVLVKGTTNGSITGLDGDYSLSNVKASDVLVVSYIGYLTQEVKVALRPQSM